MRRISAYLTSIILCVLLVALVPSAFAATQSELEEHRRKAAEARQAAAEAESQAAALKEEIAALDAKIEDLQSEVDELEPQVAEATARTKRLAAEVEKLRAEITAKEAEIAATQAEYDRQKALLDDRMTASYKQGALFYLDILLDSKDFSDFVARTTLVQRVIEDNQEIALDLAATKADLETQRNELDRTLEAVSVKRAEAEVAEKRLRDLQAQRQARVNEQVSAQNQKASMMEESEANAKRLRAIAAEEEAESARIEAELKNGSSSGSGVYNGEMAWPVPGFYRVTSPFGYRIHPIFGTKKLHTGIDIGRNLSPEQSINGAAVVAAGDGTVIYAGYRGGYGNTVMIDHGNGLVSLYAHMQSGSIAVSNGQRLSKGTRIGRVGSTGYSTGPHLHFEIRVNGSPTDPMPYLR